MFWSKSTTVRRLRKQVSDLRAEVEKRDRAIKVLETERDLLAHVAARNLERVKAESAAAARRRAEAENTP